MVAEEPLSQAEHGPDESGTPPPTTPTTTLQEVVLTAYCNDAWAALSAFQLLREQARLHGLVDLGHVYVSVQVHVAGKVKPGDLTALEAKLAEMDLGTMNVQRTKGND